MQSARFTISRLFWLFIRTMTRMGVLTYDVYNPGAAAIFPVSSVLVSGDWGLRVGGQQRAAVFQCWDGGVQP